MSTYAGVALSGVAFAVPYDVTAVCNYVNTQMPCCGSHELWSVYTPPCSNKEQKEL